MKDKYIFFFGGILSNFYQTVFYIDDVKFKSSEQAYMTFKALYFGDMETSLKILNASHPAQCKRLGRTVSNFNQNKWKSVSIDKMYDACYAKFSQNEELKSYLIGTGDKILVEASPYDCYWGIGLGSDNPVRFNEDLWRGENKLGQVLMCVRSHLIALDNTQ